MFEILEINKNNGRKNYVQKKLLNTKEEAEVELIRIFESKVKKYRNLYDISYSSNYHLIITQCIF